LLLGTILRRLRYSNVALFEQFGKGTSRSTSARIVFLQILLPASALDTLVQADCACIRGWRRYWRCRWNNFCRRLVTHLWKHTKTVLLNQYSVEKWINCFLFIYAISTERFRSITVVKLLFAQILVQKLKQREKIFFCLLACFIQLVLRAPFSALWRDLLPLP
jgi:hypothetical protein